jgi:hypothetical protein
MRRNLATLSIPPAELAKFRRQIRQLSADSGKEAGQVMRMAMRSLVGTLSSWTPPRRLEQGEIAIRGDVGRAVETRPGYIYAAMLKSQKQLDPAPARNMNELADIHRSARNSRGRVPKSHRARVIASIGMRENLVKQLVAHIGRLKGGWNAAAKTFGVRVSSWVWRHGTKKGSALDNIRPDGGGSLEATNSVPYVGRQRDMVRRAMKSAARNVETRLRKMLAKEAAKFNAKS